VAADAKEEVIKKVVEVVVEANGHVNGHDEDNSATSKPKPTLVTDKSTEEESLALSLEEVTENKIEADLVIEDTSKKVDEDKVTEELVKAVVEETLEKLVVEDTVEKAVVEDTIEKLVVEEIAEKLVVEEIAEKLVVEDTVEKAVVEEIAEKLVVEDTVEKAVEEIAEKLVVEQTLEKPQNAEVSSAPEAADNALAQKEEVSAEDVADIIEEVVAAVEEEEAKTEIIELAAEKQGVSFQEEAVTDTGVESVAETMATNGDVEPIHVHQDAELTLAKDAIDDDVSTEETSVEVPEIELIIKASTIDGRRRGACIFCQEYFMDLYLLAELKAISLKITTVDMKRPPIDFRSNFEAAQPPILIDTGVAILENEKIERHIMKHIPGGHNLFVPDSVVEKKLESLYNKFKMMLVRQDETSKKHVVSILKRIDETLEEKGTRFLTGDTLCCFDCELMPKLQHIRVAGRFFLDFDIPTDLVYLWRYIKEMYDLDAFTQSCPADQDIIHIYKMQRMSTANTLNRTGSSKSREELEAPTYLTSVPEGI